MCCFQKQFSVPKLKVKAMKGNSLRTEGPLLLGGKLFTFTFHSLSVSAIDLMYDLSPGNSPPSVSLSFELE